MNSGLIGSMTVVRRIWSIACQQARSRSPSRHCCSGPAESEQLPTGHQGPAAGIDSDCSRSTDLRLRSGGANLGASLPTEGETGGTRAQPRQQRSPREASYSMSTLVDIFAIIGAPPVR